MQMKWISNTNALIPILLIFPGKGQRFCFQNFGSQFSYFIFWKTNNFLECVKKYIEKGLTPQLSHQTSLKLSFMSKIENDFILDDRISNWGVCEIFVMDFWQTQTSIKIVILNNIYGGHLLDVFNKKLTQSPLFFASMPSQI